MWYRPRRLRDTLARSCSVSLFCSVFLSCSVSLSSLSHYPRVYYFHLICASFNFFRRGVAILFIFFVLEVRGDCSMLSMKFTRLDCPSKSNAASSQRGTNKFVAERERERARQKVSLFFWFRQIWGPKKYATKMWENTQCQGEREMWGKGGKWRLLRPLLLLFQINLARPTPTDSAGDQGLCPAPHLVRKRQRNVSPAAQWANNA